MIIPPCLPSYHRLFRFTFQVLLQPLLHPCHCSAPFHKKLLLFQGRSIPRRLQAHYHCKDTNSTHLFYLHLLTFILWRRGLLCIRHRGGKLTTRYVFTFGFFLINEHRLIVGVSQARVRRCRHVWLSYCQA